MLWLNSGTLIVESGWDMISLQSYSQLLLKALTKFSVLLIIFTVQNNFGK